MNKYKEEESTKSIELRNKHLIELKHYQDEIEATKLSKKFNKELEIKNELLSIQKSNDSLQKEQNKLLELKLKEKLRQELIMNENLNNLKNRQTTKELEAKEDFRLMQEYSQKLDKDQFDRENAFKNRTRKLDNYAMKYNNEGGAGKKHLDNELLYEKQLLNEISNKEKLDVANDIKKQNLKKQREIDTMETNRILLEKKNHEKLENNIEKQIYSEKYSIDLNNYQNSILNSKLLKKQKQQQYCNILNEHINLKKTITMKEEGMLDKEKEINKSEINKILQDRNIYQKVLTKIGI